MSLIIMNLVSVFLLFDGNPVNVLDPTFNSYGCDTYIISTAGRRDPVSCDVRYDARADRSSEYYTESSTPEPGEVLMGCIYSYDQAGNRSDCVAPEFNSNPGLTPLRCAIGPGGTGTCEDYFTSSPSTPGRRTGTSGSRREGPEPARRGPSL